MDKELTDAQLKAINLMMDGKMTLKDIAKDCGVEYQTVRLWRTKPDFIKELAARRRESMTLVQSKLMAVASQAADKLIAMMDDKNAKRIPYQAVKAILDMAMSAGMIEFEERLQTLEEALAERQV